MFISIAPSLLAATRTAMMLWNLASNGNTTFQEVSSCAPYEAKDEACISIFPVSSLPAPLAGKTWKYRNQYVSLVVGDSAAIIAHEIGHSVIGMNYHATPKTSLMSPAMGPRCLTREDSDAYKRKYGMGLQLWCLP